LVEELCFCAGEAESGRSPLEVRLGVKAKVKVKVGVRVKILTFRFTHFISFVL
jgi:hypothetical protein